MKLTEENAKKLGEILLLERKKRNFSLEQIKQKLESLDILINRSDIHRIEQGQRKTPNALLLSGLCQIYGLNQTEIFTSIGYHISPNIESFNNNQKIKVYSSLKAAAENDKNYFTGEIGKIIDSENEIVAFRVEDNNMKNSFTKGELIFLEKEQTVENNKIGVFFIDNEYKIYKKKLLENGCIMLLTDDESISPILVYEVKEIGKIIGVYREL